MAAVMHVATAALACLLISLSTLSVAAQASSPGASTVKPKYSIPWGLRPALAPRIVRSDSSLALADTGSTFVSTLLAGYRFIPDWGVYGRVALTHNAPKATPMGPNAATTLSNGMLFGLFTPEVAKELRLPVFLGVMLPLGSGGGNDGDKDRYAAQIASIYTRSAMENPLFSVNYLTAAVGLGAAWIHDRLTLQTEATVLQLFRVRGENVEKDERRTNFTAGFHAGYAVIDMLTLSVEARFQRWLSEPAAAKADATRREQASIGAGARLNLPMGDLTLRPGFAYFQGVDDPMKELSYRVLTFDIPLLF